VRFPALGDLAARRPRAGGAIDRLLTRFRRHGLSTRVYLVALVVALLGPGLVFTAVLLDRYARSERARFESDARESVRGIATAVDRDIAGLIGTLRTLAIAGQLRGGVDLEAFRRQASLVRGYTGLDVVLRRADGQELVNTHEAPGTALKQAPRPYDARVIAERRPIVSGAFAPSGDPRSTVYAVAVPVVTAPEIGPATTLVLAFEIPAARLRDLVRGELRPGWTAGIADAGGTVLARSDGHEDAVGRPSTPGFAQGLTLPGKAAETWIGADRTGRDALYGGTRTRLTDWVVGASLHQTVVEGPLMRWLAAFAGFGILALALSSWIATRLWSYVQAPLRTYAAAAGNLARGEPMPKVATPLREVRRLGQGLEAASAALSAGMRQRDAALTELRESEARFRHMADSAPALIWMTDADGAISFANLHYDHIFGRPAEEMLGAGWRAIVHPDDLAEVEARFGEAFARRAPLRLEIRVVDRDGATRWLRCEGVPRLDDHGGFLGYTGCNVDVTDAKIAGEHQTLLIHELNHRVKNTLATVQSIAMQSLRGLKGPQADAARAAFEARLLALARAHDVLTRQSWESADLDEVVADAVAPLDGTRTRFAIAGPPVRLPPRMALSIAMALHELGTNAVKYGALSNAAGRVAVAWTIEADARLHLTWTERGGPPVEAPESRGFGSRLIERNLARELAGSVSLGFAREGVTCVIDAPLRQGALPAPEQVLAPA
jgi:PAS domain S-box-containing protein